MNDNKQKFLKLEFFMRNIKILTARLEVGITKIAKDMKTLKKVTTCMQTSSKNGMLISVNS